MDTIQIYMIVAPISVCMRASALGHPPSLLGLADFLLAFPFPDMVISKCLLAGLWPLQNPQKPEDANLSIQHIQNPEFAGSPESSKLPCRLQVALGPKGSNPAPPRARGSEPRCFLPRNPDSSQAERSARGCGIKTNCLGIKRKLTPEDPKKHLLGIKKSFL